MKHPVPLWMTDTAGERWLDNPQLIVANRPRRKNVYTNPNLRRGTASARSYMKWVRSHRGGGKRKWKAKRNFFTAGPVANPAGRRRPRTYVQRARAGVVKYFKLPRRNPPAAGGGAQTRTLMGIPVPALEPLAGGVLGLIAPPLVHSFVGGFIPASIQQNTLGRYVVRAAEVVLPSILVRKFINARIGNYMLIAGFAKIAVDAVAEFAPGIIPGMSGMGWQPMLGMYTSNSRGVRAIPQNVPVTLPGLSVGVPMRLSNSTRF